MRYYQLLEHSYGHQSIVSKPEINDSYSFEGLYNDYDIYKSTNGYFESWIASNSKKENLGFLNLQSRGGKYYNIRNMMAYSKGAVSSIVDCLLHEGYKLISDDIMTSDGEKFFLKYASKNRLKTINLRTGSEEKWNDSMIGTQKDPRNDMNPNNSKNSSGGKGDQHDVYWLIESIEYPIASNKFGVKFGGMNKHAAKWIDKEIEDKNGFID